MWVFGYGSLMWDGLEKAFDGTRIDGAVLPGYRRAFNKASTGRWGTRECPGPTLGLEPDEGTEVVGSAFLFPEAQVHAVLAKLRLREGPSFTLLALPVRLPGARWEDAVTALNDRTKVTYIGGLTLSKRASMARRAVGEDGGRCVTYVRNIRDKLREMGITDDAVEEFAALLDAEDP